MNILKALYINQEKANLHSEVVKLDLFSPGRAAFTCSNVVPQKAQLVEFNASFAGGDMRRVFYGYVELVTEVKTGVYEVLAREFSAMLNQRIAINLRHCTPANILAAIADQTSLEFVLPESDWTTQNIARFQHIGGGYMALDYLLKLWSVTNGIWQQQTDGRIYVGEVEKSASGSKTITLPANVLSAHSVTGGTLPLSPRLRPGVGINILAEHFVVHSVDISGEQMRLNWSFNPWSKNLKAVV